MHADQHRGHDEARHRDALEDVHEASAARSRFAVVGDLLGEHRGQARAPCVAQLGRKARVRMRSLAPAPQEIVVVPAARAAGVDDAHPRRIRAAVERLQQRRVAQPLGEQPVLEPALVPAPRHAGRAALGERIARRAAEEVDGGHDEDQRDLDQAVTPLPRLVQQLRADRQSAAQHAEHVVEQDRAAILPAVPQRQAVERTLVVAERDWIGQRVAPLRRVATCCAPRRAWRASLGTQCSNA